MRIALRLAAFVPAVFLLGTAALDPQADAASVRAFGAWDYALEKGEGGPPNRVLARVFGDEGSALLIACSRIARGEGEPAETILSATISQKAFLGPSSAKGRSTVYWLDDRPPELSYWVYRGRFGQLREEEAVRKLLASLATAERVIIDLADYRLDTQSVRFGLKPAETAAVVERFSKDCQAISSASAEGDQRN